MVPLGYYLCVKKSSPLHGTGHPTTKNQNAGPGWIPHLIMGAFCKIFIITTPELLTFMQISVVVLYARFLNSVLY